MRAEHYALALRAVAILQQQNDGLRSPNENRPLTSSDDLKQVIEHWAHYFEAKA